MNLVLAFLLVTAAAQVDPPALPTVSFVYDRPQLEIAHYEIVIGQDGKGIYRAETKDGLKTEMQVSLNEADTKKIWAKEQATSGFKVNCETKIKNLAQTGKKELIWTSNEGSGSCIYNYSDDKEIMSVTETFQSVAQTLDFGQQLEHAHRFDRLGLDGIMTALMSALKDGRASNVQNIVPTLKKMIADTSLMDRVRSRAESLLDGVTAK